MIEFVIGDSVRGLIQQARHGYKFDAAVFSPPYNMGVEYDAYNDEHPVSEYLGHSTLMAGALRLCAHKRSVVWLQMGPNLLNPSLPFEVLERYISQGWRLYNQIVWIKSGTFPQKGDSEASFGHYRPMNSKIYLHRAWEMVFMLALAEKNDVSLDKLALGVPYCDKSNLKRWKREQNLRCRGNVWYVPYETTQKTSHPCPFPVKLVENCLKLQGLEGITHVLDPYCGTGATAQAAATHGKEFLGFDFSENYINEALKRPLGDKVSVRHL